MSGYSDTSLSCGIVITLQTFFLYNTNDFFCSCIITLFIILFIYSLLHTSIYFSTSSFIHHALSFIHSFTHIFIHLHCLFINSFYSFTHFIMHSVVHLLGIIHLFSLIHMLSILPLFIYSYIHIYYSPTHSFLPISPCIFLERETASTMDMAINVAANKQEPMRSPLQRGASFFFRWSFSHCSNSGSMKLPLMNKLLNVALNLKQLTPQLKGKRI